MAAAAIDSIASCSAETTTRGSLAASYSEWSVEASGSRPGQLVEMSGITMWSTISMASRLVTGWLFSTIW